MIPIWVIYSLLSGTTAMGFWVIAHECGHGAFSKNKTLETITGYLLHSFLLVPYFSWQRSHAVHHRFTNNVTNGETHVPLVIKGNGVTEKVGGEKELHFSNFLGKKNYGILQLILHLIFGWPAFLFTGSTETGKSIMKLASKNLTPLTLELSGTNPVIVFKNANLEVAAKRIVWGKFFNSGQSCMAPNHIFVDKEIENIFIEKLKKYIVSFYGDNPIISENLSKLEKKQFTSTVEILKQYEKEKRILFGGTFSKKKLKISPTILRTKLNEKDILQQELFSSLLPVIGINDKESALKQISQTSKPLAIYLFGGNKKILNHISIVTSSGTICINDVMLPVLIPNLPFGGVGQSGIGKFHGEEGFRNFSNQKSITFKSFLFDLNLRYPPYERVKKFLKFIFQV